MDKKEMIEIRGGVYPLCDMNCQTCPLGQIQNENILEIVCQFLNL